jgi:hypothetical protein
LVVLVHSLQPSMSFQLAMSPHMPKTSLTTWLVLYSEKADALRQVWKAEALRPEVARTLRSRGGRCEGAAAAWRVCVLFA